MANTADSIMRAAAELFAKRRAEDVSIADIAGASGVSEQTVFRHFRGASQDPQTKDTILLAIFADTRRRMIEAARQLSALGPDEAIVRSFDCLRKVLLEDEPAMGRTFLVEGRRANARTRPLLPASGEFNVFVEYLIHEAQKTGRFRRELNVEALRQAIQGIGESLLLGWVWEEISPNQFSAGYTPEEAADVFRAMIDGLRPGRPHHPVRERLGEAKRLLLYEMRLEAKRFQLCQQDPEDEEKWVSALQENKPEESERIVGEYRHYKYGLLESMFGEPAPSDW